METGDYAPTNAAEERSVELRTMLDDRTERLSELREYELAEFNEMLESRGSAPESSDPHPHRPDGLRGVSRHQYAIDDVSLRTSPAAIITPVTGSR